MKTAFLALAAACSKAPAASPSPGSGSASPTVVADSSSTATTSAVTPSGTSSGSAAPAPPPPAAAPAERSAAARALDDVGRMYEPIVQLADGPRIRAACGHAKSLGAAAHALVDSPTGVDAQKWRDDVRELSGDVEELQRICIQIPKADFGKDESLADHAGDFPDVDGKRLYDAYAKLVVLVPDATPIGAHTKDPVTTSEPPPSAGATSDLPGLRDAMRTFERATAKLAARAKTARSTADACGGVPGLHALMSSIRKPAFIAGPPDADRWDLQSNGLSMLIGDLIDRCVHSSKTSVEDIRGGFESLHRQVGEMLAACGK